MRSSNISLIINRYRRRKVFASEYSSSLAVFVDAVGCGNGGRGGSSLMGDVDMTFDEEMMDTLSVELDTEAVLLERVTALPPDRLRNEGRSSSLPKIHTPRI